MNHFPKIIALSGYARSGKDATGAILVDEFHYTRVAFVDSLKAVALGANPLVAEGVRLAPAVAEHGWHGAMDLYPEVRNFLQRLSTEGVQRTFGQSFWAETLFEHLDPHGMYVITDCRFPSDALAVRARGGVIWRVNRPGVGPANAHQSEMALDNYAFDDFLDNRGTLDHLREEVVRALHASL